MIALADALDRLLDAHRETAHAHLEAAAGDARMALVHIERARRALADAWLALRVELTKERTP